MSGYTPMMQQYLSIKEKHPDSILFFRLGDFYEMFFQDANTAAQELDLTLTAREAGKGNKVPMAGVPHHAAENYIAKLIHKGFTVAICDQVEDPKEAKGVVKREVTRIITPGTLLDPALLSETRNNYLCSISLEPESLGVAFVDVSTGNFMVTQLKGPERKELLENELARLNPAEVLVSATVDATQLFTQKDGGESPYRITRWHESYYTYKNAKRFLAEHFGGNLIEDLEWADKRAALQAAGAVFSYIVETQRRSVCHIQEMEFYEVNSFMVLDTNTRRNLELTQTIRERKVKGSLLWVLDRTKTAMGSRCLRKWVEQPLQHVSKILERLDAVEELVNHSLLRNDLRVSLSQIQDLERLISRSACGHANARDIQVLASSLAAIPIVKGLLSDAESELLISCRENLDDLHELVNLVASAIAEDPPLALKDGGLIREGFDEQIDRYREAAKNGKTWLSQYEAAEREQTGIKNLKIGYNRVFGYYFTVTNSYSHLVPSAYRRKQTLANAERFTTDKLMDYESMILGAEDKQSHHEYELFCQVRDDVNEKAGGILDNAQILAHLDALCSLAETAVRNRYMRPDVHSGRGIDIQEGRHPVVEHTLEPGGFVANNTLIDPDHQPILLITGPNMAGKSTYMRQTALIVLMAQIGSFVPAARASIGVVDRIFTRVGAQDDLFSGESTFMVEMNEMAYILKYATPQSLLLLDEVGRGTSTFDGLSIAWAVTEHIHNHPQLRCQTLFATHYHELTDLEDLLPGVKNCSIAVREKGEQVIFLRNIISGRADRSYGIQVARLAGLPAPVVKRAKELLYLLEARDEMITRQSRSFSESSSGNDSQMSFFAPAQHPVIDQLKSVSIDEITPLQALQILSEWKNQLEKEGE
jgi:DNA mismatch repair protein MutS